METIYTIPINEAFDAGVAEQCRCPFCRLYEKLQQNELELILGASMMEPEVRIQTNRLGFCPHHYEKLFARGNRLGMGLILESHLGEIRNDMKGGAADLIKGKGSTAVARAEKLEQSCYVCNRIAFHFGKMTENTLYLWRADPAFRKKFAAQPMFCLPHYRLLAEAAKASLGKKEYPAFYAELETVTNRYFDDLCADVSHFCKKFDYRYEDEPWGNSKDAVERAIRFLGGER